jgi:hypothetical protein
LTPASSSALEASRRLWARERAEAGSAEDLARAAERLCGGIRVVLVRWIGTEGFHVLAKRALEEVRPGRPALTAMTWEDSAPGSIARALQLHDPAAMEDAIVTLVATMMDLLSRVLGEPLAMGLIENGWAPGQSVERTGREET